MTCAGADGCASGWVVATRAGVEVVRSIDDLVTRDFVVIAIDMPIGMPADGRRSCEQLARRYVSPRGSTIFPTPVRQCLEAATYAEACAISRAVCGRAISQQAWRILPKIKEIDEAIARTEDLARGRAGPALVEAHPECSFAAMNGARPLVSKHTAAGLDQRLVLVRDEFGVSPPRVKGTKLDDVLDAYAVLWTAERFASHTHFELASAVDERDERGLVMRIVV